MSRLAMRSPDIVPTGANPRDEHSRQNGRDGDHLPHWLEFYSEGGEEEANAVGGLRHARFVMSAHLADWHPWERYQDFFMASRDQGGGALLDESHFIDLMLWFFGVL